MLKLDPKSIESYKQRWNFSSQG